MGYIFSNAENADPLEKASNTLPYNMSGDSNSQSGAGAANSSVGCFGKYCLGEIKDPNLSTMDGWKRRLMYHIYWSSAFYLLFVIYGVVTLMRLQALIDDYNDDALGGLVETLVRAIAEHLQMVIILQSVATLSSIAFSAMIAKSDKYYAHVSTILYASGALLLIWLYNFIQFILLDGLITVVLLLVGAMQIRGLMLMNALKASMPNGMTVSPADPAQTELTASPA